jgi:hypothetical protein
MADLRALSSSSYPSSSPVLPLVFASANKAKGKQYETMPTIHKHEMYIPLQNFPKLNAKTRSEYSF